MGHSRPHLQPLSNVVLVAEAVLLDIIRVFGLTAQGWGGAVPPQFANH